VPVNKEENADIKVSGTDEIERSWVIRWLVPDNVTGQFKSTLSYIDIKTQKVLKVYNLDADSDESR
jgi:hypothetical protein